MTALPLGVPLILIVIVGPVVAFGPGSLPLPTLILWALTALAAVAVIARYRRIEASTLWLWLLLTLLALGYFAKSTLAAMWLQREGSLEELNPEWAHLTIDDIVLGYGISCLAFLGVVASLGWSLRPRALAATAEISLHRVRAALVVLASAVIALAALRGALGIGVMGVETENLPLGLDSVVFRVQSSLIPALLLVVMWSGEASSRRMESNLAAMVLGIHLLAVSAVAASKAGPIYLVVYVVGLWIACGRMTRDRTVLLALLGLLAVLAFVIGGEMRIHRIEGLPLAEAAAVALLDGEPVSLLSSIGDGLQTILLRISGADGIWFVTTDPVWSAATINERLMAVWDASIVDLYTRDVVGVTWLQDFRAPGFIGAFLLVFGAPGLLLCTLVFPALSVLHMALSRAPGAPALMAFSAAFITYALMDGTFRWQDFAVFFLTLPAASAFAFWLQAATCEKSMIRVRRGGERP